MSKKNLANWCTYNVQCLPSSIGKYVDWACANALKHGTITVSGFGYFLQKLPFSVEKNVSKINLGSIHECLYQLALELNLAELFWRRSIFLKLSLFVNLLLPPFAKWCGLSLPKTISFLHLKFSFVYRDIYLKFIQYAKRLALSCLCTLKRTCDSDYRVPLPIALFKKYYLYSIP